jgi:hypothetical protein
LGRNLLSLALLGFVYCLDVLKQNEGVVPATNCNWCGFFNWTRKGELTQGFFVCSQLNLADQLDMDRVDQENFYSYVNSSAVS